MSKLNVVNRSGDSAPFLRGILTRSLQKIGLTFSEAYGVASTVRSQLAREEVIGSPRIRETVSPILASQFSPETEERYRLSRGQPVWIRIHHKDGEDVWFSRAIFRYRLEICGITHSAAEALAHSLHERLVREYSTGIEREILHQLACQMVLAEAGAHFAKNLEAWHRLTRENKTLLILIGGAPGVGKSTMAAHLATRLNITRTQSTDMLREVLRTLRSPEKNPELHYSSFEAWRALDDSPDRGDMPTRIEEGYNRQADEVELAAQALLERSQHEQFSMIIEGVHIRPSMIQRLALDPDVIVVPILLTVSRKKTLKRFFKGRSLVTSRRGSQHYLDNFDAIWHLQSALTVDAKTSGVAAIVNDEEKESTSVRVFSLIASAVADHVLPNQGE